jgi:DNA-binding NarL/FixJ family response regulator
MKKKNVRLTLENDVGGTMRSYKTTQQRAHTKQTIKKPLRLISSFRDRNPHDLTGREQEVLFFIWSGFTNNEIGEELKISVTTVEAHRGNMMMKMRVSNTAQLLRTGIEGGFLQVG